MGYRSTWVSNALDNVGVGKFQMLQMSLAGIILFYFGLEVLMVSAITTFMEEIWALTPLLRGAGVSLILVGMLIGSLIGGPCADSIGRRPTLLLSIAGIAFFGALTALAGGPKTFLLCRFGSCVTLGMSLGACNALVVESTSEKMRDQLANWVQLWFVCGECYICLVMFVLLPQFPGMVCPLSGSDEEQGSWRKVLLWASSPAAITLPIAFFIMQESPYFLVAAGKRQQAIDVLQRIAEWNGYREIELGCAQDDDAEGMHADSLFLRHRDDDGLVDTSRGEGGSKTCGTTSTGSRATGTNESSVVETEGSGLAARYKAIFSPGVRRIVAAGAYFSFLANFLALGLNFAVSQVFMQMEGQWHLGLSPMLQTLIACCFDVPGAFLVFFMLSCENFRRLEGLFWLMIVTGVLHVGMVTISIGDAHIWMVLPATYMTKFSARACFNLTIVYLSVAFPSECRCTAMAFCFAVGKTGGIIAPWLFEALSIVSGPGSYMLLSACFCGIGASIAMRLLVSSDAGERTRSGPATGLEAETGIVRAHKQPSEPRSFASPTTDFGTFATGGGSRHKAG